MLENTEGAIKKKNPETGNTNGCKQYRIRSPMSEGWRTLDLNNYIIFRNCKFLQEIISNKPYQCRNTDYWADDTIGD